MNDDELERVSDMAARLPKYFRHWSRIFLRLDGDGDDPTMWRPVSHAGVGMTAADPSAGLDGHGVKVSFLDSTETRFFNTTEHMEFACRR
jgi:hypothetical protein